jgi:hypothetical protein
MAKKLDFDKLIKKGTSASELLKELKLITAELEKLEKEGKDVRKSLSQTFKSSDDVKKLNKAIEQTLKLEQQKIALDKQMVQVNKALANEQAKLTPQYQKQAAALEKLKVKNAEAARERKLDAKIANAAAGSYKKLDLQTQKLANQYKKMSVRTEEQRKRQQALGKQINANRDRLKRMDSAMGQSVREVGNYTGALKKARAGLAAIALGVTAVIGVMRRMSRHFVQSVKDFDVQAKAEKSLEVALGGVSQALLEQARALQQRTIFGDEATIQGMSFLAQMGLEEDQIARLTPAILDMAQAKKMDLKAAFDLVAKSVGSSTNALSRYGIQIEGAAGSNERVDSTLQALNKSFKGQAQAATVGAGRFQQWANAMGDARERLGQWIVGLVDAALPMQKQSELMKEQQTDVNALTGALITNIDNEEKRENILVKINAIAPELAENIRKEGTSIEGVKDALVEWNTEIARNIELQAKQEILIEEREKLLKAQRDQAKDEIALRRKGIKIQEGIAKRNEKLGESTFRLINSQVPLKRQTQLLIKVYEALDIKMGELALSGLKASLKLYRDSTEDLTEATEEYDEILGLLGDDIQKLIDIGGKASKEGTPPPPKKTTLTAYQQLQQEIADLNLELNNAIKTGEDFAPILTKLIPKQTELNAINFWVQNLKEFGDIWGELKELKTEPILIDEDDLVMMEEAEKLLEELTDTADEYIDKITDENIPTLINALGLSEEEMQHIENAINTIKDQLTGLFAKQAELAQQAVDVKNQAVNETIELLQIAEERERAGLNNNKALLEERLAQEKKAQQQSLDQLRKAKIAEVRLEQAATVAKMIKAVANIYENWTSLGPLGQIAAVAEIGAMLASFAGFQSQLKNIQFGEGTRAKAGERGTFTGDLHSDPSGGEALLSQAQVERGENFYILPRSKSMGKEGALMDQAFDSIMNGNMMKDLVSLNFRPLIVQKDSSAMAMKMDGMIREQQNTNHLLSQYKIPDGEGGYTDLNGNTIKVF